MEGKEISTNYTNENKKAFLMHLHDEKVKTQDERAKYVINKLAFLVGFYGIGSLKIESLLDLNWLLYFIPIIAICYDFYIYAANSSIKKIGSFLRQVDQKHTSDLEKIWERYSAEKRDFFAPFANLLVTLIITIASCIGTYSSLKSIGFWIVWYTALVIIEIVLWVIQYKSIKKLDNDNKVIKDKE